MHIHVYVPKTMDNKIYILNIIKYEDFIYNLYFRMKIRPTIHKYAALVLNVANIFR